jgi:hypothetical protein
MGCDCTTTRHDVTLIEDDVMVAYVTLTSRCEPNRIAGPDGEHSQAREDTGARGCRVVYTLTGGDLNDPTQLDLVEFSAGAFTYTFAPILAPLQTKTLSVNTPTSGADCRKEAVGRMAFRRPDGSGPVVIGGIPVCVAVSRL